MKKEFLSTFLFFSLLFCAFSSDYVIAAQKFEYTRGQRTNSVTDATAELLPQQIFSNLNSQIMRSVLPDEQLERSRYDSRQERYSLYLQLSSEYKKRDVLVLEKYSAGELKSQIAAEEKKIKEIEEKIQENIDNQKIKEQKLEVQAEYFEKNGYTSENTEKTELEKFSSLVKNLFTKSESLVSVENIKFYKDDKSAFYSPEKTILEAGYTSPVFEKAMISAKINALMTGTITSYGEYSAVTVKVYRYPGAKLIGTVTEVGSKKELDFISANIARQLVPVLTNSMKISVDFDVEPENAPYQLYIDDSLQNNISDAIILDSGVHKIQFVAEGYEGISLKYFFDGNTDYKIKAHLEPEDLVNLHLTLLNPVPGTIYANSIAGVEKENKVSEIQINGTSVIGNFTDENGFLSFYYIPENKINSDNLFFIKETPIDKDKYIDSRRKWMYTGYSALMVSLIPMFYTQAQAQMYSSLCSKGYGSAQGFGDISNSENCKIWTIANYSCIGVSISAGIFWGVELVRYLLAANKVIPETPAADKNGRLAAKQQKNLKKLEKEKAKKAAELEKEEELQEEEQKSDINQTDIELSGEKLNDEASVFEENISDKTILNENSVSVDEQ